MEGYGTNMANSANHVPSFNEGEEHLSGGHLRVAKGIESTVVRAKHRSWLRINLC